MPVDGTFPSGTAAFEKRNVSDIVAVWDQDLCVQCGQCGFACPHSVIRGKYYDERKLDAAPPTFKSASINARGYPDVRFTLQLYVEDCTGCGICVEVCPEHSPRDPGMKAINLAAKAPILEQERANIAFFEALPMNDRARVDFANVRGVQFLQPLFEFSGACAGCGETPYLKLLSQLFGDRLQIANATGCSSIYGGNLPVTPWTKDEAGRGPAWSNSLFEDNAEFGLGFRLAADKHLELAKTLLRQLAPKVGDGAGSFDPARRRRSASPSCAPSAPGSSALKQKLAAIDDEIARDLLSVVDHLIRRSIWIVGGDGWAYDIGYGGLDHVLASSRDVNVLVLDTEVYSNTGGQASKATPLGAVAKFAAAGKRVARKDLALQAIAYGNVYVAQVAMGANPQHTLLAFREAEAYPGPVAHPRLQPLHRARLRPAPRHEAAGPGGRQRSLAAVPLQSGHAHARASVPSGWTRRGRPSRSRTTPTTSCATARSRKTDPEVARALLAEAQQIVTEKYRQYEELASRGGETFTPDGTASRAAASGARRDSRERRSTTHGSDHQVHGPHAAKPADRVGLAAQP